MKSALDNTSILHGSIRRLAAWALTLLVFAQTTFCLCPARADEPQSASVAADDEVVRQCDDLTKQLLKAGIELERFSLNYRLEGAKLNLLVQAQYYAGQEAGSAGGLAFEAISTRQLGIGRRHPLKIDKADLKGGLNAALVTAIIAGSSSATALAWNTGRAWRNHRRGYSSAQAARFVESHLSRIDQLLQQRDALVAAHANHPLAPLAIAEGKILHHLRNVFFYEFATFNRDVRAFRTLQNTFYALNIATNTVTAIASHYGVRGVDTPKYNKPANILFIIAGATTMASPLLSSAAALTASTSAWHSLSRKVGGIVYVPPDRVDAEVKAAEETMKDFDLTHTQYTQAVTKTGIYAGAADRTGKILRSETRVMKYLGQVAVENVVLGPVLGSMLMTQGIIGTRASYQFSTRPLKQINLNYQGAVVGTVATSIAVVGTAGSMIADVWYLHHLKKKDQLPWQLIKDRLKHLDEVEKAVNQL